MHNRENDFNTIYCICFINEKHDGIHGCDSTSTAGGGGSAALAMEKRKIYGAQEQSSSASLSFVAHTKVIF